MADMSLVPKVRQAGFVATTDLSQHPAALPRTCCNATLQADHDLSSPVRGARRIAYISPVSTCLQFKRPKLETYMERMFGKSYFNAKGVMYSGETIVWGWKSAKQAAKAQSVA
jgi:hypothetical protein